MCEYLFAVADESHPGVKAPGVTLPATYAQLQSVRAAGLVAFVSEYRGPALEEVSQAELPARLLIHQQVLEALMAAGDLLPVRLGTVLPDRQAVADLLEASQSALRDALVRTEGLVEVDVAAVWDIKAVLGRTATDPDVVAARDAAMAGPAADREMAAVALGRLVEAKIEALRDEVAGTVLARLRANARDIVSNPVTSQDLVCSIALLMSPLEIDEVDASLHELDASLGGRFDFRRIGPLPPYSFATVGLRRIEPAVIAEAAALLGVPDTFDAQTVLDNYRELALARHPDRSRESDAAAAFEALTNAKATLLEVTRISGGVGRVAQAILTAEVQRTVGRS